jgi:hypothetical protein
MREFAEWMATTPVSIVIQDVLWIVPTVQTVHILAIAVVMSSIFMIDLRILGLAGRSQTMTQTARRFLPWVWGGLAVLLVSGAILITGEPVRELVNWAFWTKMATLAFAVAITLAFQHTLRRNVAFWERSPEGRRATRVLAVAAFLVWCAIAVLGRWIAYVEIPY